MKLKIYEEVIFVCLVLLFSYSCVSLLNYSSFYYLNDNNILIEAMDDDSNTQVDPDLDIHNTDYTKEMKTAKKFGFSKEGSWSSLQSNVKGMKDVLDGIILDQKKLTKKGNPIGVKFAVDTGFQCNDPDGNSNKQYTYIDNEGSSNLGLALEIGNSIVKYATGMKGLTSAMSSSDDTVCKEVELDVLSNSGKKKTQTVNIDIKEIENIDPKNILNIKTYDNPDPGEEEPEDQEENENIEESDEQLEDPNEEADEQQDEQQDQEVDEEGFNNFKPNLSESSLNFLLLNDKLFYKDFGVFMYFFMLNFLFLYFIFILVINN
tara:strand:+ start:4499 stop:5455 length:957 start_codon:yes stop_codon:yes gene_type:complete